MMEACVCLHYDYDGPDINDKYTDDFDPLYPDGESLWFSKLVPAVMDIFCIECGDKIPTGKIYEHVDARYEGEWTAFYTCIGCYRVREDLFECGFRHGAIWEDLYDVWSQQISEDDMTDEEYDQALDDLQSICG